MTDPLHAFGDLFDVFDVFGIDLKPANADDPRRDQEPPPIPQAARDFADRHFRPRSQKRGRGRSAATLALRDAAVAALADAEYAMTVRHLFYLLLTQRVLKKTQYDKLVGIVKDLREEGVVPWDWIADRTRVVMRSKTWDGVEAMLTETAELYRRDLMRGQPVALQIWAESDSIASVIAQIADRYTVPVYVGRGFTSRGYIHQAAEEIVAAGKANKRVMVWHVGDYDPSGEHIYRDVFRTLKEYVVAARNELPATVARSQIADLMTSEGWEDFSVAGLEMERLALTPQQIEEYDLQYAEVANPQSTHAQGFTGLGTVEVEALRVEDLLGIVEDAILSQIDQRALEVVKVAEASEREVMQRIAATPVEKLAAA